MNSPVLSQASLCEEAITGIFVLMLMSGPGLIHNRFSMSGLSDI